VGVVSASETGLLAGKRLLITGVLTEASIAFSIARLALEEGAEVVLTGVGRGLSVTQRTAARLPEPCDVVELDATDPEQCAAAAAELGQRWDGLDGVVHAVAHAPPEALGGGFLTASWDGVASTLRSSTYSLAALASGSGPLLAAAGGGAVVGMDFDAAVAWPGYDWMGVAKAGLESTCRYLARDLGAQGTRVNLVAAGPLRTMAAKSVPGFDDFEAAWSRRAPLGWDAHDPEPAARTACVLLSDWTPAITGEVVHADGGAHAMGADIR
jgi:enoyl-[acyl-carrier protein] reductase I